MPTYDNRETIFDEYTGSGTSTMATVPAGEHWTLLTSALTTGKSGAEIRTQINGQELGAIYSGGYYEFSTIYHLSPGDVVQCSRVGLQSGEIGRCGITFVRYDTRTTATTTNPISNMISTSTDLFYNTGTVWLQILLVAVTAYIIYKFAK